MKYVIKLDNDFNVSKEVWDKLYFLDKETTIFQSYQWNKQFYFKLCSKLKLHNLIFYNKEVCVAIFPLIERNLDNKVVLEFIGCRMVDYLSPIILEEHKKYVYKQFKHYIKNSHYFFYGYDIKSSHTFCKYFSEKFKTIEVCYLKRNTSIPKSIIKENNYDKRYLSEHSNYFIEETFDIKNYYKHIELYLDNMKNLRENLIDEELKMFWKDYILSNIDNLHCLNLKIENELAYSILYEIKNNKVYLINYGFNIKFKRFAPGKLLLMEIIKEFSSNYDIDLSRGKDEYKLRLGCCVEDNIKFIYPKDDNLWNNLQKLEFDIGFFPHKL